MSPRGFRDDDSNNPGNEGVPFNAKVLNETDLALLCLIEGELKKWIPKSAVHDDSAVKRQGHVGMLLLKRWWVEKYMDDDDEAEPKRKKKLAPLSETMSVAAVDWLKKLKAKQAGLYARPCVALVELERRQLVVRSEGPGAETFWKAKGG